MHIDAALGKANYLPCFSYHRESSQICQHAKIVKYMYKSKPANHRGDYLHGANEAVGAGLIIHPVLGQTKVCHFDVAFAIQEHVLLNSIMKHVSPIHCSLLDQGFASFMPPLIGLM